MPWTWKFDPDDADAPASEEFANQADAESWLGEAWRTLAEAGVISVTLFEDDKASYGPMPLSE